MKKNLKKQKKELKRKEKKKQMSSKGGKTRNEEGISEKLSLYLFIGLIIAASAFVVIKAS